MVVNKKHTYSANRIEVDNTSQEGMAEWVKRREDSINDHINFLNEQNEKSDELSKYIEGLIRGYMPTESEKESWVKIHNYIEKNKIPFELLEGYPNIRNLCEIEGEQVTLGKGELKPNGPFNEKMVEETENIVLGVVLNPFIRREILPEYYRYLVCSLYQLEKELSSSQGQQNFENSEQLNNPIREHLDSLIWGTVLPENRVRQLKLIYEPSVYIDKEFF